jgi:hypothetical protein
MSDDAIAWAISPPIVPAPTTAALETNILRAILRNQGVRAAGRLLIAGRLILFT